MSKNDENSNVVEPIEKTLFQGAELSNCAVEEAGMECCTISNAVVSQSRFDGAEFRDCTFENNQMTSCLISDGSIDGLHVRDVKAKNVLLEGARLRGVSLKDIVIVDAECVGLIINGVNVGELLKGKMSERKLSAGVNLRSPVRR